MSAQEVGLRRNFIAILSDETEEQRAVEALARSDRLVRDYFLGLMATLLTRYGGAR
jgi:hypothetical protein